MNNNSTLLIKYCDAYITAHINNTKEKQIQFYHNHYKKRRYEIKLKKKTKIKTGVVSKKEIFGKMFDMSVSEF